MYKFEKYKIFLGWSVQGSLFRWKSSERFKIHSVRKLAEENDSIMSPWSLHQMERCERARRLFLLQANIHTVFSYVRILFSQPGLNILIFLWI